MRLRQIALVAEDLATTRNQLARLLGIEHAYRDPNIIHFGLDNWVAPIGDTFLEVVSPVRDGTTAGRYLERRGGDGGYVVILQVDDLEGAKQRLAEHDARIVWNSKSTDESSGESTEGAHVHPRDCGGAILSLDEAEPVDAWVWAGPDWRKAGTSDLAQISGCRIQAKDPGSMARRWAELLGLAAPPQAGNDGVWELALPGLEAAGDRVAGTLLFVPDRDGRGDGVTALELLASEAQAIDRLHRRAEAEGLSADRDDDRLAVEVAGVRLDFRV